MAMTRKIPLMDRNSKFYKGHTLETVRNH
jgi:hypothetical protein